jgi:hypothetical protein
MNEQAKQRAQNYMRLKDGYKETLEEDLKFPIIIENGLDYLNLTTKIFNNGAKWQSERMYSEEEIISLLIKREYALDLYDMANDYEDSIKWFEQFKKK